MSLAWGHIKFSTYLAFYVLSTSGDALWAEEQAEAPIPRSSFQAVLDNSVLVFNEALSRRFYAKLLAPGEMTAERDRASRATKMAAERDRIFRTMKKLGARGVSLTPLPVLGG